MRRWIWLAAGVALGGAVGWLARPAPAPEPAPIIRFDIAAPADHEMLQLALAPDGRGVAFVAHAASGVGRPQLFYRALHQKDAVAVPGTDGARSPFFSPDGRSIAFFADDALRRVSLDDGAHAVICDAPNNSAGGTWNTDGTVVFAPLQGRGLMTVDARGGAPESITQPDGVRAETEHGWPTWLPDGTGVLFIVARRDRDTRMAVWSTSEAEWRHLLPANGQPRFVAPGQLVYALNGELLTVLFDAKTLELSGTPTTALRDVGGSVSSFSGLGDAHFDLSRTGALVSLPPSRHGRVAHLSWPTAAAAAARAFGHPIARNVGAGRPDAWSDETGDVMLNCHDAEALIARRVGDVLDARDDAALRQHLSHCNACQRLLEDQTTVARALASRSDAPPPVEFARRLSERLDGELAWLDVLNWRSWTVRLAPVAAALVIVAAATAERATVDESLDLAEVAETWAIDPELADLPTTALFWQAEVSADSMLEAMLTAGPDDPLEEGNYDQ